MSSNNKRESELDTEGVLYSHAPADQAGLSKQAKRRRGKTERIRRENSLLVLAKQELEIEVENLKKQLEEVIVDKILKNEEKKLNLDDMLTSKDMEIQHLEEAMFKMETEYQCFAKEKFDDQTALNEEVVELKNIVTNKEEIEEVLKDTIKKGEDEVMYLKDVNIKMENEVATLQIEKKDITSVAFETECELKKVLSSIEAEVLELKKEITTKEEEIDALKDEVDNNANVAEQAIANWKELYLKEKALHDKIKNENECRVKKLEDEVEHLEFGKAKEMEKVSMLETDNHTLNNNVDALYQQLKVLQNENECRVKKLEDEVDHLEFGKAKEMEKVSMLETDNHTLNDDVDALHQQLKALQIAKEKAVLKSEEEEEVSHSQTAEAATAAGEVNKENDAPTQQEQVVLVPMKKLIDENETAVTKQNRRSLNSGVGKVHFRSTLRRAPSVLNTSSALPKQRVVQPGRVKHLRSIFESNRK